MKKLVISALMACAVIVLPSCEKEEIERPLQKNETQKKTSSQNKDGGGDDEDTIIIYGLTQNVSEDPIDDVEVILFVASTSVPVDTVYSDAQGNFTMEADTGAYYFEASALGFQNLQTGNMTFLVNSSVTLTLEE